MLRKELKNKPLVEAILEVKWDVPKPQSQAVIVDQNYQLLVGRFFNKMQNSYPHHDSLPTSQFPPAMVPYVPQYQFRTGSKEWPLVQIGFGIMTVNETEKYKWETFERRCVSAVNDLVDSYPSRENFKINELSLRYIDAIALDTKTISIFDFLKEKMKIEIVLPENLFSEEIQRLPESFHWQVSFPQSKPGGVMTLRLAIGELNGQPSFVWETLVQSKGSSIKDFPMCFNSWLNEAHNLTDDWFFKLIEGDLEKRFMND